ncbi:MAG: MMPL family transporter [Acidobacteriota bacterium]|nr:MAG: MMPL family transporter [Acidobacteriota bacterium]
MGDGLIDRLSRLSRKLLIATARLGVHHPKSVLALTLALTVIAAVYGSRIELSTDLTDLLTEKLPAARRMRSLLDDYGASEPLAIALSGKGSEDVEDRIDLALAIQDRLREHPSIRLVAGLFGEDPWALLEGPQAEALLLYLDPEEIDQLAVQLTPESIDRTVAQNLERLQSPIGPLAARLIAEDPLGIARFAFRHLEALKGRLRLVARDGVLVTEDEQFVITLARVEGSTHDFAFTEELLGEISSMAREELSALDLEGTAGVGLSPLGADNGTIHIGLTGAAAIIVDYRRILAHDIRSISGVAFLAVMALFLLAFRRLLGLLIAGVPLVVGIVWTIGFAAMTIGHLNVFTAGSVAILCGLAIDFTIHLFNRYLEEVHSGKDMIDAFGEAYGETGSGILAAAATTAWAFLAAGLSTFRGLRDLGLLCAAGILLSLAASLLLVPAMAAIAARIRPTRDRPRGLASFGLGPVLTVVVRHPWMVVVAGVVVTLLLAWPALRARLDEDFRRFRPQTAPSIELQTALSARIGTSLQPVLALLPAPDEEMVLERAARVEAAFDPLVHSSDGVLAAVMGPARVVPPPSRQRAALERLASLRADGRLLPAEAERALLEAYRRHGFRIDERAEESARRLRDMLSRSSLLSIEQARYGPLGALIDDLVLWRGESGVEGVVSCYPRPDVGTRELVDGLRAALARSQQPGSLVGGRVLSQEVKPVILRDGARAIVVSAAGVLLILLVAFGRPLLVLLTFLPLVVGVVASVGLLALFRVDFNLVSISMLPLILGIGIDNGIHVVHRFMHHDEEDLVGVFRHTGRGIVMTSLTTMVGFGALVFADYLGLISSGVLALLGVGATLVTAVTLLPALLVLVHVRATRG